MGRTGGDVRVEQERPEPLPLGVHHAAVAHRAGDDGRGVERAARPDQVVDAHATNLRTRSARVNRSVHRCPGMA